MAQSSIFRDKDMKFNHRPISMTSLWFEVEQATMILRCGGVNGCFEYNSHLYCETPRHGGNLVSSLREGKNSTLQQEKTPGSHDMLILMCLGCHGGPSELDPMILPHGCRFLLGVKSLFNEVLGK